MTMTMTRTRTAPTRPLSSLPINTFLLLFALSLSPRRALSLVDPHFENCSLPVACSGLNITFPFYVHGRQPSYCGHPGFELSCTDDRPVITLSGDGYVIRDIFYKNQSLWVSNAAVSDDNATAFSYCTPGSLKNLTLPSTMFHLNPNVAANLSLLYDCNISLHAVEFLNHGISCPGKEEGKSGVVLGIYGNGEDLEVINAAKKCRTLVVAPVAAEWRRGAEIDRGGVEERVRVELDGERMQRVRGKWWQVRVRSQTSTISGVTAVSGHVLGVVHKRHGILVMKVAIVASGVGIAIVILVVYSIRKKSMIRKHITLMMGKKEHSAAARKIEGLVSLRRYTYKDIKRMTNSFREKLGQGGYGYVYKGKLRDGQLVAVKLLKKLKGDGEEFINEVASISRTSHVNIVSLLGFFFEGSKRALVYEFMPNGSLEKFICKSNTSEANLQLSWEILYNISLGIAQGLEYLHRGCNARILHFDMKPYNILLDRNNCPKISDFGLAKICPREESTVSMLGARGTAGYIAPELVLRSIGGVPHRSDVYSYGMTVLEMVGGRKNVDVGVDHSSEIYFPHWIHRRLELQEELGFRGITNEEDEGIARKMIVISLWCIQIDPRARPSMTQVVEMLRGSVEALQIPPKPTLSSPSSRSPVATTDESSLLQFDITAASV